MAIVPLSPLELMLRYKSLPDGNFGWFTSPLRVTDILYGLLIFRLFSAPWLPFLRAISNSAQTTL